LFLEPTPGKASLNLLKMARQGLAFELRTLVHKAGKSGEAEQKTWIETKNNKARKITIEATPLATDGEHRYFLVLFNEENIEAKESLLHASKDKRVKQLEEELHTMKEDLRSFVEAQEAANEELQSVNEEIISSNEELQSINEELETSKEELESSNEELLTINQELNMRNEQLAEVQEYSEAMFATVREALLILDKNFRIKTANNCFYKTFSVTEEETQGKLLYDIGNRQWDIPQLRELLEEIIPRNAHISDFEVKHKFEHIGEKIMLLNARRLVRKLHSEHLILLAMEDITHFRQAQRIIEQREEWFRATADNAPVMIWVAGADKRTTFVNKAWLTFRGHDLDNTVGRSWIEDMHPDDVKHVEKIYEDSYSRVIPFAVEYRARNRNGEYKLIMSHGQPNYTHDGKFIGFIGSCMEMPEPNAG
jgi:two-component system, chemotaxis family, CheB/CheR fusion protein